MPSTLRPIGDINNGDWFGSSPFYSRIDDSVDSVDGEYISHSFDGSSTPQARWDLTAGTYNNVTSALFRMYLDIVAGSLSMMQLNVQLYPDVGLSVFNYNFYFNSGSTSGIFEAYLGPIASTPMSITDPYIGLQWGSEQTGVEVRLQALELILDSGSGGPGPGGQISQNASHRLQSLGL